MKNFIKTVGVTSCLVAAMGITQALSQTRYPDWASNGPALIGAKNGIAPLDGNAAFAGVFNGSLLKTWYTASSITIIAGGAKYAVGDVFYDDHGNSGTVTAVDSNGGVTAATVAAVILDSTDANTLRRAASTTGSGYNFAYKYVTQAITQNTQMATYPYFGKFLNSRGLAFDGTDAQAQLSRVFAGLSNNDAYVVDSASSSIDVSTAGVSGKKDYLIRDYKNSKNFYGDGAMAETLDEGVTHRRFVEKNTDWVASDFFDFTYGFTGSPAPANQHNMWVSTTIGKDHLGNLVEARGDVQGIGSDMTSYSHGDASNFDTNAVFTNYRYGSDWQWANLSVIQEFAHDPFIWHNTQEWLGEWDWGGWGEDGGPNGNARHSLMITGWQVGGGFNHDWTPTTSYTAGDQIQVTINGILCSVVATTTGTSGENAPDWNDSLKNGEDNFSPLSVNSIPTVTDGSVTWRYNGILRMSVADAIVVSFQPDNGHVQDSDLPTNAYNTRTPIMYHSLIKTDALYDGALLDFANAQSPLNKTAVAMRIPSDFYMDMSATFNSTSSNNVNLLGYDSSQSALTFKHSGGTVFSVNTSGTVTAGQILSTAESHFAQGAFTDPDNGVSRDAKFGNKGIAVSGGIKTDTISMSSQTYISVKYASLPASPTNGQYAYCSDCYSKLREDGDTATGVLVFWNGTRWNDVLGLAIQH